VCDADVRVEGPSLKAMRSLAHTEYLIHGRTSLGPREILRRTLFAPTVTGSPLESACRVLHSYERGGRGYYSGVAALISTDHTGQSTMDSSILIRTAEIDAAGNLNAGFGATLVRHSDPDAEVAETHAKAAGLLAALCGTGQTAPAPVLPQDTAILDALAARNARLAAFWLGGEDGDNFAPEFDGLTVLVVDHEDTFTAMLTHQLRALGLRVTVADWRETVAPDAFDLVVLGPGPGDPRAGTDPKIRSIQDRVGLLLRESIPFVAVCLSHQVLSAALGLPLHRRPEPNQGTRCEIDFFGRPRLVGFYNTFVSRSDHDRFFSWVHPEPVRVSRAAGTGDVHALSGHGFASVQFHPESLLTEHGVGIIRELLASVLWPGTRRTPSRLARTSRRCSAGCW
jgi:2-amino-4-deoxychorismate synthase